MFEHSILGKIPVFLRFLCEMIAHSATYRALAHVWHAVVNCAKNGVAFGFLFRDGRWDGAMAHSKAISFVQKLLDKLFLTLQNCYKALKPALVDSLPGRGYARIYRHHWSAHPVVWLGLFVLAMLVIPHDYWANSYALLGCLALTALWAGLMIAQKREVFRINRLGVPFYAFAACCVLGVLRASETGDAIRVFIFFLTAFLLYALVVSEVDSEEKLHRLLGFLLAGVFFTALFGFYQRMVGVEIDASLTDVNLNSGMPGRVFSTFENPNNYAELLVLTLPLCFVFCTRVKNSGLKVLSFVMLACAFGALLMTYSRSCWVSFAIAALVFVFLYDKRLLPLVLLVGVAAIPFLPESILDRILTIGSQSDTSNAYRIYIWEAVLEMIQGDWFTGIGLGPESFKKIYIQFADPYAITAPHSHMLYLEIWVELGLVGLVSFFWLMVDLLRSAVRTAKRTAKTYSKHVLYACVAAFAGIAFSCAAEYIWFYPRVLFAFFLVAGILKATLHMNKKELTQ